MAVFWNVLKRKDFTVINLKLKFAVFTLTCFVYANTLAQGNLLIFPKRLVFEDRGRVKQLSLSNTGQDTAIYNVSFTQFRMNEYGGFEEITEPGIGQNFATPYLRIFPRIITLAPNENQIVKVQLTKTSQLKEGEYRSHIYFRAVENISPLGKRDTEVDSTTIGVELKAVFGISIATIIKKGESNTITSISDLTYEKGDDLKDYINFNLNRTGNMSTYGDIYINYISDKNKTFEVAEVSGVAVYTPGEVRKVKIQVEAPTKKGFVNGKFNVFYRVNKKEEIIAEAELKL